MIAAELNYTVTEQECLATVHAMKVWRCYLERLSKDMLTLVTDHCPNTHLQDQQNLSRRQVRWVEYLQRFHYKWSYRPGRRNVADPVSGRTYTDDSTADPSAAFVGAITRGKQAGSSQPVTPPGNGRPDPIDQATVSLFQECHQNDTVAQSLVPSGVLTAAHGLLWHGKALVVPACIFASRCHVQFA